MLVKGHHPECAAGLHDVIKSFPLAFSMQNCVLDSQIGAQYFKGGDPAAADSGQQSLTYNPANRVGQPDANLALVFVGEHTDDTVDRGADINGM